MGTLWTGLRFFNSKVKDFMGLNKRITVNWTDTEKDVENFMILAKTIYYKQLLFTVKRFLLRHIYTERLHRTTLYVSLTC